MVKKLILTLWMAVSAQWVQGQTPLSFSRNSMRAGDVLCKVKIDYVDVGEAGIDKVWTLGQISEHDKDIYQGVLTKGDTITVLQKGYIRHYIQHEDTLFYKGEQQRRAYRMMDVGHPLLRYPFSYGDSISGEYKGSGREENFSLTISGWGYTVADGMGVLTDGKDTLYHVTRLRMVDDCVENYDGEVKICTRREHYMWYCAGHRYPVMESYKWMDTAGVSIDSATYLSLPVWQSGLGDDSVNDSILLQPDISHLLENMQNDIIGGLSSIQAELSMDGLNLTVNYSLTEDCTVTFIASDMMGNVLGLLHNEEKNAGEWQEEIRLARRPIGNVLALKIQCNGEVISMKAYQKNDN